MVILHSYVSLPEGKYILSRSNLCQSPATKASHVAIICLSSKLCSTASFCTRAIPSLGRQMRTVLFHKAQGRCQPVVPVSSGGFSIPSKHSHDRFTRQDGEKTSHNLNPPTNQDDAGHCTSRLLGLHSWWRWPSKVQTARWPRCACSGHQPLVNMSESLYP